MIYSIGPKIMKALYSGLLCLFVLYGTTLVVFDIITTRFCVIQHRLPSPLRLLRADLSRFVQIERKSRKITFLGRNFCIKASIASPI